MLTTKEQVIFKEGMARLDSIIARLESGKVRTKSAPPAGSLVDILRDPAKTKEQPAQKLPFIVDRLFELNQQAGRK